MRRQRTRKNFSRNDEMNIQKYVNLLWIESDEKIKLITNKPLFYLQNVFRKSVEAFRKESKLLFFNSRKSTGTYEVFTICADFLYEVSDKNISDIMDFQFLVQFFEALKVFSEDIDYGEPITNLEGTRKIKQNYLNLIVQLYGTCRVFELIENLLSGAFFVLTNDKYQMFETFLNDAATSLVEIYNYSKIFANSLLTNVYEFDGFIELDTLDFETSIALKYVILHLKFMKYTVNTSGNLDIRYEYYHSFPNIYDILLEIKATCSLSRWCDSGYRLKDYFKLMELVSKFKEYDSLLTINHFSDSDLLKQVQSAILDFLNYVIEENVLIDINKLLRHTDIIRLQPRYYFIEDPAFKKRRSKPTQSNISVDSTNEENLPLLKGELEDRSKSFTDDAKSSSSDGALSEDDQEYLKTYLDFHSISTINKSANNVNEAEISKKLHPKTNKAKNGKDLKKVETNSSNAEVISIYFFKDMRKMSLDLLEEIFFLLNKRDFKPVSIHNYWNIDKTILDLYAQNQIKLNKNMNFIKHPEKYVDVVLELDTSNCIEWLSNKYQSFYPADIESILVQTEYDYCRTVEVLQEALEGNFGVLENFIEDIEDSKDNLSINEIKEADFDELSENCEVQDSDESDHEGGRDNFSIENIQDPPKLMSAEANYYNVPVDYNEFDSEIKAANQEEFDGVSFKNTNDIKMKSVVDISATYQKLADIQLQNRKEVSDVIAKLFNINSDTFAAICNMDDTPSSIVKKVWQKTGSAVLSKLEIEEYEEEETETILVKNNEEVEIFLSYDELVIWKEIFPSVPNSILKEKYYDSNGNSDVLLNELEYYVQSISHKDNGKTITHDFQSSNEKKIIRLNEAMIRCIDKISHQVKDKTIIILNDQNSNFSATKKKVSIAQKFLNLTLQFAEYCLMVSSYDFSKAVLECVLNYEALSNDLKRNFDNIINVDGYDESFNLVVCKQYDIKSNSAPKFRQPRYYPIKNIMVDPEEVEKYVYFLQNIPGMRQFNLIFALKVLEFFNIEVQASIELLVLIKKLEKIEYINSETEYLTKDDLISGLQSYVQKQEFIDNESLSSPLIKTIEKESIKTIKKKVINVREVEKPGPRKDENCDSFELCKHKEIIDDALFELLSSCVISMSGLGKLESILLVDLSVEKWWSEELRQRQIKCYQPDIQSNYTLCNYVWPLDIIKSPDVDIDPILKDTYSLVCEFLVAKDFLIIDNEACIEVIGKII